MTKAIDIIAWIGSRIGKPPGWERVVRAIAPPESFKGVGDICLARDGIGFIAQPAVQLGWNVVLFGTYEPELRKIIQLVLKPNDVAIDIGANVGWHTLLMATVVGHQGRVIAVEPNASVRERLLQNIHLNRLSQVDVLSCAVSDSIGVVDFFGPGADDVDSGSGHIVQGNAEFGLNRTRAETRRIDDIVDEARLERLDFIKIDIEGFEWPALQGGERAIIKFRPHIVFEYDSSYATRGGASPQLLVEFFRRHRYRLFAVAREWVGEVNAGNWPRCADVWGVPER